jgi:hypothetical protein
MTIYCYPKLSDHDYFLFRALGPGLGNLLFPWARAQVAASTYGLTPISPTWPQLKIGTLLRRESDARTYQGLFNSSDGEIQGLERIRLLAMARRVPEHNICDATGGDIVEYSGMGGMFESLVGHNKAIYQQILSMTKPVHKKAMQVDFSGTISIHVRLGDFGVAASGAEISKGKTNTRIPIEWYCEILTRLRKITGERLPANIFSDGTDAELSPILQLSHTRRVTYGSAIGDILALANSNILLCSGSTFSAWGSFLGEPISIWHEGQLKRSLHSNSGTEFEVGSEGMNSLLEKVGDVISLQNNNRHLRAAQ